MIYYIFEGGIVYKPDKNIYCDMATYIEEEYICWYTGRPCTISPIPNKYLCHTYDSNVHKHNKHREEKNVNGK